MRQSDVSFLFHNHLHGLSVGVFHYTDASLCRSLYHLTVHVVDSLYLGFTAGVDRGIVDACILCASGLHIVCVAILQVV